MPDPEPILPKSVTAQVKAQEAKVAELEKAVKALLAAAHEWNDVTGRDCMPEGTFLGETF